MRAPGGPLELKPEQKLISGYFNLDNGTGKSPRHLHAAELAVAPIFEQWMAPLKDLGVTTITTQNTGGTDHLVFDAVGIPGFQFIQDPMDYETRTHHSNMDTFERLQTGRPEAGSDGRGDLRLQHRDARPDAAAQAAAAPRAGQAEECAVAKFVPRRGASSDELEYLLV